MADLQQKNPSSRRSNTIICIDEPELYLHPTTIELVRDALMTLSNSGYQILFSTHSASLLSSEHAINALQIHKSPELGTQARKPISKIIESLNAKYPSHFYEVFKLNNASQIFFSDEVLLVEGKTELRVLPNIYTKIHKRPFHLKKLSLVSADSKTSLLPIQKVLGALGIPSRILTDLDFIGNCKDWDLIDDSNAHYFEEFRSLVERNKDLPDLNICQDHVKDCSSLRQIGAKKFKTLAQLPEAKPILKNIHNSLKVKGIYIWCTGDIEAVYGFNSKREQEWRRFNTALINNESIEELVSDYEHLRDAIEWIS